MDSIEEVRSRLCGSPFIVRDQAPKDELVAYRESAIQLLEELRNTPENDGNTASVAAGPTVKTFVLYRETLSELESLVEFIEFALAVANAQTPAEACKALYELAGWPLNGLSKMSRKQLREAEQNILLRAGIEVGLLVSSLASRSRFFPSVLAREKRRSVGVECAKIINADHAELRQLYQPAVEQLMQNETISYTAACVKLGPTFGVSERTIRKHTTNPSPKNRGRAKVGKR